MENSVVYPPLLLTLPFCALLAAIALSPLRFPDWWGKHYPKVCFGLGALVVGYYVVVLKGAPRVLHTAEEYFGFIALIGSLFVVSGGIHINLKGEATPPPNNNSLSALKFGTTSAAATVRWVINPQLLLKRSS